MGVINQTISRSEIVQAINAVSVGAGATVTSDAVSAAAVRRVRAWHKTKGANSTAKLQGSFDGTTWYDLQTLTAGVNAIVEVADAFLRVSVNNAGASAETNDVWLLAQV